MALYIGLMSGTSADAIDAALVEISEKSVELISSYQLPITTNVRSAIYQLALDHSGEIEQIRYLDKTIADLSCKAIENLCAKTETKKTAIRAIGSHGQTVRHYPASDGQRGYSLQVGDPNIIAETTGITTVADFRRRDIAAGGQGAPLAASFHRTAFHNRSNDRVIVNIGGIANITYLPRQADVIGFDTGPGNGLMDSWFQQHHQGRFDSDGHWAASGNVDKKLLSQLLKHSFLTLPIPKSTGREEFNLPWLQEQLALCSQKTSAADIQATLLAFTTETIANHIDKVDPQKHSEIYICGGGSHNRQLMKNLTLKLQPRHVATTLALGIHPDWVEAIAFAWLAKQSLRGLAGNIPSVTGAHRETVLGGIYWGVGNNITE